MRGRDQIFSMLVPRKERLLAPGSFGFSCSSWFSLPVDSIFLTRISRILGPNLRRIRLYWRVIYLLSILPIRCLGISASKQSTVGLGISEIGNKVLPDYDYLTKYLCFGNPSADYPRLGCLPYILHYWWYLPGRVHGGLSKLQPASIWVIRWLAVAWVCLDMLFTRQFTSVHHNECL